jgi:hypothetical protein
MLFLQWDRKENLKEFWTIEQKDEGGMLGGYPRWLSADSKYPHGSYSATYPIEFKRFATKEELEASTEWEWAKKYPHDYKIVRLEQYFRPLSDEEFEAHAAQVRKLLAEMKNGREFWRFDHESC